ncbi:calcium permeable stress-gated cation channel 1-like isoform X2 [Antedon mediterranea]|uniref:calcium permeable stress-gated cation channel 1-like isoform X2 n=1 Tax=Antedon mediterranea TaxID=105859 RepID=UPI003AF83CA0
MDTTPAPTTPGSLQCTYIGKNTTLLYAPYGGIPLNLSLNVIFFAIILLLYAIFRKLAGEYGRIALVQHGEERWTSMFFGDHSKTNDDDDSEPHYEDYAGFCSWIRAVFTITDNQIRRKSGVDAIQYLQFQRYLIGLVVIICVLSIGVILPVNFSGDQEGGKQNFGHTTISNLPTDSKALWVHTFFAMIYFVIAIIALRHFKQHLPNREEPSHISRTLFVIGIPLERTEPALIRQHFQEAYPDVEVTDVQFAYDISRLQYLDQARKDAQANRIACESMQQSSGVAPTLRPGLCGQIGCHDCCGGPKVDAIEYYSRQADHLASAVMTEKQSALQSNLGMAFVTVSTVEAGARIVSDYATLKTGPPTVSSVSRTVHSTTWTVDYAPWPDDIIWQNLSVSNLKWWVSVITVNICLFLVLFFLTTPSVILTSLDSTNYKNAIDNLNSAVISQFLPTLLLLMFAALLPQLVIYSSYYFEYHWTRTTLNHVIMRKTYVFLMLMLLILPSLGLASAQALFEYTLSDQENIKMRWGCMFLPDNGAFFVNYIITSAFIGTALELIRFPELFLYIITMVWTRSEAEKITARKKLAYEFQYGVNYAWMLTLFSIVFAYSITCPLIVPFGMVYFIFKHMVDRYNIYFAYAPSRIDKGIHDSAGNFVVISGIILQLSILFFSVLRLGSVDPHSIVSAIFLVICIGYYVAKFCFHLWTGYIPPSYSEFDNIEQPSTIKETELKNFVPDVLMKEGDGESDPKVTSSLPRHAYGTMGPSADVDSKATVIEPSNNIETNHYQS